MRACIIARAEAGMRRHPLALLILALGIVLRLVGGSDVFEHHHIEDEAELTHSHLFGGPHHHHEHTEHHEHHGEDDGDESPDPVFLPGAATQLVDRAESPAAVAAPALAVVPQPEADSRRAVGVVLLGASPRGPPA